ncbi:hypothetical protein TH66_15885 [Carbonactinospora thermoautotrophica]|uniref:Uncharacterized protein n=1 Tax=Carbonactinospora thermoautotrophica TaxID=1469144 RepID=A0A132NCG7_9ACTN|nr:hypothetical protein TH66_15885 [Carbonactinospora thermoautotrophica]KWX07859.1 hypothetical protein TR74_17370 [Carbonactinospora thermoautotrophica]
MAGRTTVYTAQAPAPAGHYSQAVVAGGLVFLAGQTPRRPDGSRLDPAAPMTELARAVLENLEAVARAAGTSLRHAVRATVYLADLADKTAFEAVWRNYVGDPPPAREVVVSALPFRIEVSAVCLAPDQLSTENSDG